MVVETDVGTTGLGVVQDANGRGLTAHHYRKILEDHWQTPGVLAGGKVTGRSDLRYHVAEGTAVVSRGSSDGYVEVYWPETVTGAVPANTSGSGRIDAVYVRACDPENGDADNHVRLGVATGVGSPERPSGIPAGATVVDYMYMASGAGSTAGGGTGDEKLMDRMARGVNYALPHGASRGILRRIAENKNGTVPQYGGKTSVPYLLQDAFPFEVQSNVEMRFYACVSTGVTRDRTKQGMAAVNFYVDDQLYTTRKIAYDGWRTTYELTTIVNNLTPGWHSFAVKMWKQDGYDFQAHFEEDTNPNELEPCKYVGRVLVVVDMGAVK